MPQNYNNSVAEQAIQAIKILDFSIYSIEILFLCFKRSHKIASLSGRHSITILLL